MTAFHPVHDGGQLGTRTDIPASGSDLSAAFGYPGPEAPT